VIADGEAADMLIGRYGSHSLSLGRICRRCNVKSSELSNPDAEFDLITQQTLRHLMEVNDIKGLQKLSQHNFENAFERIDFGLKDVGIVDSVPHEPMHLLKQGLMLYVLVIFLNLLGSSIKAELDGMATSFWKTNRQSGFSSYPRVNFSCGVASIANMTAGERVGVMFMLAVLLRNEEISAKLSDKKLTRKYVVKTKDGVDEKKTETYKLENFLEVFEILLIFEQWIKSPRPIRAVSADEIGQQRNEFLDKHKAMLEAIKTKVPRVDGTGWNFSKFHGVLHLASEMLDLGSVLMFDASRCESFHGPFCKAPARLCQMTHKNWELKVGEKVMEKEVLSTLLRIIDPNHLSRHVTAESSPEMEKKSRGSKFTLCYDYETNRIHSIPTKDGKIVKLGPEALTFIGNYFTLKATRQVLQCSTEKTVEGEDGKVSIVRCHSDYQGEGPWNDWGMVCYEDKIVPAKFHCWIDQPNQSPKAIVQLADKVIDDRENTNTSKLFKTWSFPRSSDSVMGSTYECIDAEDYVRECLIIQEKNRGTSVLEVLPYEDWWTKL